jgi:membrane protein DedA with SNARE-associated domain
MQSFLAHEGYIALIVLALTQAACIPIPSELTLGFAGVLAGEGRLNLAAVIALATLGEVVGSYVAYTVGRVGGRPVVERVGRYVRVTSRDLDRAEEFFARRGAIAVLVGRAVPVLRAVVSIVAGIAEMPTARFLACSFVGTLVYVSTLSSIGYGLSSAWRRISHDFSLAGYGLAALTVVVIVVFLGRRMRAPREQGT